ncbi:MAG: glycosyltransferase family 4 protein [Aeropyrum sp.]|nr:glycosyltransferase family 4 protein [Aeropyrum sp.]MCE4616408.1 glycosyltransferase family 4 protein [Aeropyrum sp.]
MGGGVRRVEELDAEPLPRGSRVVMVMDFHPSSVGGVQSHVRDLSKILSEYGYDVIVVSRKLGKGDIEDLEAEGYYTVKPLFNIETVIVPPDPIDLRRELSALEPDVVHSHHIFTLTSLMALKTAKELGKPRVATNHSIYFGYDKTGFWRLASFLLPTRYLLPNAQAVISVSRAADSMVESIVDGLVDRYIIPNGVDTERFRPSEPEDPEPTVVFVGRLVWRKGVHVLVRAFRSVVREFRDAKLVIVGKGEMEPLLRVMAKRYDIEDNVRMLGVVPEAEKPRIYSRGWVASVPSIANESFGIVALEAMACGKPVVASRHGGLKDIVVDGVSGRLVKPGSSRELAQALIELLGDESLRRRMGAEARRLAEEIYDWKRLAPKILKIYGYYRSRL